MTRTTGPPSPARCHGGNRPARSAGRPSGRRGEPGAGARVGPECASGRVARLVRALGPALPGRLPDPAGPRRPEECQLGRRPRVRQRRRALALERRARPRPDRGECRSRSMSASRSPAGSSNRRESRCTAPSGRLTRPRRGSGHRGHRSSRRSSTWPRWARADDAVAIAALGLSARADVGRGAGGRARAAGLGIRGERSSRMRSTTSGTGPTAPWRCGSFGTLSELMAFRHREPSVRRAPGRTTPRSRTRRCSSSSTASPFTATRRRGRPTVGGTDAALESGGSPSGWSGSTWHCTPVPPRWTSARCWGNAAGLARFAAAAVATAQREARRARGRRRARSASTRGRDRAARSTRRAG